MGAGQFPLDGSSKARDGRDSHAAERQRPQLASGPFSVLFVESGTRPRPITNARIGLLSWSPRIGCVPPTAGAILSIFKPMARSCCGPDVAKNGAFTSSMQCKVKVSGASDHDAISLIS